MVVLSHRGLWWPDPAARNTPRAFEAAARAGFGLELDVCLVDGRLWIAHAPAEIVQDKAVCPIAELLPALNAAPLLAWNVKTRGCGGPLAAFLATHGIAGRSFLFDMELVDPGEPRATLAALDGSPVLLLARASDKPEEPLQGALTRQWAGGVWLDCNGSDWVAAETIAACKAAGRAAYVVSPELHGRPLDLALWRAWAGADGIATDFPHLLASLDAPEGALQPVAPWWAP